jgi:hypothetical protein
MTTEGKTRLMSEQEINDSFLIAGFLGAYKFWVSLVSDGEDIRTHGDRLLRAIAQRALKRVQAHPDKVATPEVRQAFEYCGIDVPSEDD